MELCFAKYAQKNGLNSPKIAFFIVFCYKMAKYVNNLTARVIYALFSAIFEYLRCKMCEDVSAARKITLFYRLKTPENGIIKV